MPALTHDAHCCICHGKMKTGESFRWYQKTGVAAAARGASRKERWLPMHDDPSICREIMDAPSANQIEAEQKRQAGVAALTAALAAGQKLTPEQALAMLAGN